MHALANNRTIIMLSLQLFKNRWTGETGQVENLHATIFGARMTALEWFEIFDGNGRRLLAETPDICTNMFVHTVRSWYHFYAKLQDIGEILQITSRKARGWSISLYVCVFRSHRSCHGENKKYVNIYCFWYLPLNAINGKCEGCSQWPTFSRQKLNCLYFWNGMG